jgi:drug/metabolite transporter (DMT)-like permease
MTAKNKAALYAVLAAICYGAGTPLSKPLLAVLSPYVMASLLYLGAGIGMLALRAARRKSARQREARLVRRELPYTAAMIALDVAAPVLLMLGLQRSNPATVSLLNNFEIVTTTMIAFMICKEAIGRRALFAIGLITIASVLLSVRDFGALSFSAGSIFVLLACLCWGIENNCTRKLSLRDPLQIVSVKGIGSGAGAMLVAALAGEFIFDAVCFLLALALGFVSYGLSICLYIQAQRELGAARTSAYYAYAPFIGVALSFVLFRESLPLTFWIALTVMLAGTWLIVFENHVHRHSHMPLEHEHRHRHDDGHHAHGHEPAVPGEHNHPHVHAAICHVHLHTPDMHHDHSH